MNNTVFSTEYAVEVNNNNGFVRQIDVFDTYEDAHAFCQKYSEPLKPDEYLNIISIDYDEDGNEISENNIF